MGSRSQKIYSPKLATSVFSHWHWLRKTSRMKTFLSLLCFGFCLVAYAQTVQLAKNNNSNQLFAQNTEQDTMALSFNISPNPSQEFLKITLNKKSLDQAVVKVYNVLGTLVYEQKVTSLETGIVVSSWKNGVYIVLIKNSKSEVARRFIKK